MEDYICLQLEDSRIEFREEMRQLQQHTKSQFDGIKSQFVEMNGKLDKIMKLLPNWLRNNGIEPPNLIVVSSDQVISNLVDDLLEINKSPDSNLNGEVSVTKTSWIDSEVHGAKNDGSIYEEISEQKEVADVVLHVFDEMPRLNLVDRNEDSSAYKGSMPSIDCVPLILDPTNGSGCEEVREVTCHSFDPGGAYLSLTAFHDTLTGKYARNEKSSVPEIYVGGLEVADNLFGEMPSLHSTGLYEKYVETSDSGSKSDCYTGVAAVDRFILKEGTTLLLDKFLERVPVENRDYVVSVPVFVGYCFMWHLSSNKLPLYILSLNPLGSHENCERCVGECKNDVVFTDDTLFLFDPGGRSLFYRDGDLIELNQEQGDCCHTIIVDDASARFGEYYNDALGVFGGFEIVDECESVLIWDDHSDTWESILMVHDRCIPRKRGLYTLDEKMQASATLITYHKWNINGVMLVVIEASSVLSSCVAWHNTDVMTLITPKVFCENVIQQLMLSMKAYDITALLKDRNSLREMVDRVVIIQGQDAISFYIIEDNDVLKRKGIWIQMALAYSLVEWSLCTLLFITSSIFRISKLYSLIELLVRSMGCNSIDPNGVKQDAESWRTLHIISLNGATSCVVDKLQLEELLIHKNKMIWRHVRLIDHLPWSSVATLIQTFVCRASEHVEDMNCVVKFLNRSEHKDISTIILTEPCKASRWLGTLMLLTIYDVLCYVFLDAPLPRNSNAVEDAYGVYPNVKQMCIVVQTDHIIGVSSRFDHMAMQIAQMLQLVVYDGYSYEAGSYTMLVSENACHIRFYPTSKSTYTNVVQVAKNGDVQNSALLGTWLQLRNKDFGVCCLMLGAQLWMMSNFSADYHLFKTSMVFVYLKGFVWDPGSDFIVRCKTESPAAFGKCFYTMLSFESAQIIETILDEASCQIKIWNSFPRVQMCMTKERNMLQAMVEDIWITYAAMLKIFVLALFPINCASYSLWQCHSQKGKCRLVEAYLRSIGGTPNEVMIDTGPNALTIFTTKLEPYIWDPGWFVLFSQLFRRTLMWIFNFTTLRTRRFLSGRSRHDLRSIIRNNTEGASITIKYQLRHLV